MNSSSHGVAGVTSLVSPMRNGKGRASNMPATMHNDATHSVIVSPATPDTAPQKAEPMANEPSALRVCRAAARERTQGGALVCVAVLKVDITAIQAAPPITSEPYTRIGMRTSAATAITSANTTQLVLTSA